MENSSNDCTGEKIPKIAPMASPVKAPCPKESEKNAMRLDTTMVLNKPKSGVIKSTASRAFFIKS